MSIEDLSNHSKQSDQLFSTLTSISFIFRQKDDTIIVRNHNFLPEDTLTTKKRTDKVPYDLWIEQGWITKTTGSTVDYRYIMKYIQDMELEQGWKIKIICYDPWNSTQFAQELDGEGYDLIEVTQKMKQLTEPTKRFREKVYSGDVKHDGNPVLTWAISNAVVKQDLNENIMLDKEKSTERIDPIASMLTAYYYIVKTAEKRSIYETRGMRIL